MLLGIDAGNYEVKVCTNEGVFSFPSDIGEYRERKLKETFSKHDIIWEYNGEKGFGGTLAKFESEFGGTIKGKTKAHNEGILRALIAIHKYGGESNKVIIGQPIEAHHDEEKDLLRELLRGKHEIAINGETKQFSIDRVEVAPEGPSALISNPKEGLIRVIDVGSGTINFATLYNLKRIDKDSFTKQIGMETIRSKDPKEMAKGIYRIVSSTWDKYDETYLSGGGANFVHDYLKEYMPNCHILKPRLGNRLVQTKYGNAVGFYKIAELVFGNE